MTAFDPVTLSSNLTLSNSDMTVAHNSTAAFNQATALPGLSTGQHAFEMVVDLFQSNVGIYMGVGQTNVIVNGVPNNTNAAHWEGNGFVRNSGVLTGGQPTVILTTVFRCEVDCDTGGFEFFKDNVSFFTGTITLSTGTFFPFTSLFQANGVTIEGDTNNFVNAPTGGFTSWALAAGPTVDSITPTTANANTTTNIALSGTLLGAMTEAKWDDGTNPITITTLNNVTATTADTDVNLITEVYTLTVGDGVTDHLQDETLTVQASVLGDIVGCNASETYEVRIYRWDTGAFLAEQTVDLSVSTAYSIEPAGYADEVFVVGHKQSELATFEPIVTAGPVVAV